MRLGEAGERFLAYVGADDPRVAGANWVSILVALNQPLFPLYIWGLVGFDGFASTLTWLSTPFFVAVPWVSRRAPTVSRAMLPLLGAANTLLAAKALGAASGVELFLCPCAMAGAMAFRARERGVMLFVLGAMLLAYWLSHGHMGPALHGFDAEANAKLFNLNVVSVAGLTLLIALQFARDD